MKLTVRDFIRCYEIPDDANILFYSAAVLALDPELRNAEVIQKSQLARCKGIHLRICQPLIEAVRNMKLSSLLTDTEDPVTYSLILKGEYESLRQSLVNALTEFMDQELAHMNERTDGICF